MAAARITITIEEDLGRRARRAAEDADMSLSAWLAAAVAARLRNDALARFVADFEREEGPLTDAERASAARELGGRAETDAA
jgi:hypothetical protein